MICSLTTYLDSYKVAGPGVQGSLSVSKLFQTVSKLLRMLFCAESFSRNGP